MMLCNIIRAIVGCVTLNSCCVNCDIRMSSVCRKSICLTLIAKSGCCLTMQNTTSGFVLEF